MATPKTAAIATARSLPGAAVSAVADRVPLPPTENLWRHWRRATLRITGLMAADLAVFWLLRHVLRMTRNGFMVPDEFATQLSSTFPRGFVAGFEFAPALVISSALVGAYGAGDARRDPTRLVTASCLAALICLYGDLWTESAILVSIQILALTLFFGATLSTARLVLNSIVSRIESVHSPMHAVAIQDAEDPTELIDKPGPRIKIVARLTPGDPGLIGRLQALIESDRVDTVILSGSIPTTIFEETMDAALAHGCRLLAMPRSPRSATTLPRRIWLAGLPLTELTAPGFRLSQLAIKRTLDITGATIGLIALGPLMIAIAAWIKLESKGSVLFKQRRLGLGGKPFNCLKFRSMQQDAEAILKANPDLHAVYLANDYKLPADIDPRLTRSGRFLRRTSLDELPQLINVLKGQLSLVGPRPIVPDEIREYGGISHLFLSIKPGMTGSWAISGRSDVRYPDRATMELEYVRGWCLSRDLAILLKTVRIVMAGQGAL